jgi:hypothetical protein
LNKTEALSGLKKGKREVQRKKLGERNAGKSKKEKKNNKKLGKVRIAYYIRGPIVRFIESLERSVSRTRFY